MYNETRSPTAIEEQYPADYDEVMEEMNNEIFDCDEYFGATVQILDLENGYEHTILLSAWFDLDETTNHNFTLIN